MSVRAAAPRSLALHAAKRRRTSADASEGPWRNAFDLEPIFPSFQQSGLAPAATAAAASQACGGGGSSSSQAQAVFLQRDLRLTLQSCLPAAPDEVRVEALRCLARCATERNDQLRPAMDEVVSATIGAITSAPEPVAIQAIEVWTALAEHELALQGQATSAQGGGSTGQDVARQALPAVLPALLDALARGPADSSHVAENEGFELSEAASGCLIALSRATGDACVGTVVFFLEANLQSQDSSRQRAAMLAFGSIQDGPSAVVLSPLFGPMLPRLLDGFTQGVFPVANAAAWSLGRCLEMNPAAIPDSAQACLFEACIARLRKDGRTAVEACYCLDGLVAQQAAPLPVESFEPVTKVLVELGVSSSSPQSRSALMGSLTDLVGHASEECVPHMEFVLTSLLRWAEAQAGPQVPDRLVRCLRAVTARLSCESLAPHGERLLALYIRASRAHFELYGSFDEEALRAAGCLAAALGPKFDAGLPAFWPVLKAAVELRTDPQACYAGLKALRDIVITVGAAIRPYALECLVALGLILRSQEAAQERLRAPAVSAIGGLGLGLGAALPEPRTVMTLLAEQVEWASDESQERAAMSAEDPHHANFGAIPVVAPTCPQKGISPQGQAAAANFCRRGKPLLRAKVLHQRALRREVLDAALEAYEEVIRGFQHTGSLSFLADLLPGILDFACRYAGASGSQPKTMRAALRLLYTLVTEYPSELVAYVQRADSCRASVSRIACFGASCPSPKLRELAAPLARLAPLEGGGFGLMGTPVAAQPGAVAA